jgi:flagellar basal-body rod protein FlgC
MNISSLQISGSALTAERTRLDIISQNIANVHTTRGADGHAYQRRQVIFEMIPGEPGNAGASGGVRVAEVKPSGAPMERIYSPGHPDADAQGYVEMPNVNLVDEMVDLITATRAYEANVAVVNATKSLVTHALDLGRG